ncbi:MAG: winged helix-turn-helix transcriptional regulator [Thermoplasmata archaeon]
MGEEEVLDLERRRMVYQFIKSHPGLHMRGLEKRLGISLGDLRYHLDYLEKKELITSRSDGYRKTYFSTRDVYLQDRDLLALLRQRGPRKLILHLMLTQNASFDELRQVLGVSKSTLSFHLRKLTDKGIVKVLRREGKNAYYVEDKENVAELLITYKGSFLDEAVDRVLQVWLP